MAQVFALTGSQRAEGRVRYDAPVRTVGMVRNTSQDNVVDEPREVASRNDADYDLFVVHARADADFVRGYLLPALNLPPVRTLLLDDLTPGASVVSEIERGILQSHFTIAILSLAYLEDCWAVFGEQLASYLSMDSARVIPLRLTDIQLPLRLEARVSLDFTDRSDWEPETARLRALLRTASPLVEAIACPYPGMRSFALHEAEHFYGRTRELEDLIGRLDQGEREIYVIGPSGCGKSSLVYAGLMHALQMRPGTSAHTFAVLTMRPGERPTERLASILEGDPLAPEVTLSAVLSRHTGATQVLLFIDQLEEMFTLPDGTERQRFATALCALRRASRCYLVLALRADFYGALMESALWPEPGTRISTVEVGALRGSALADAITKPATRMGVRVELRLRDRLMADAADEPGVLPHVQETLRLLWERRRRRFLGVAEYDDLGQGGNALHTAIAHRADAAMHTLTVRQQSIARRMLLRLVSFGEGRADTRRQQPVHALRSAADNEGDFSKVVQRLVDARLLTVDVTGAIDACADLSHEALITAWPALRAWIAHRRVDEQRRRRLEAKVDEWTERGQGTASLLDPVELAEALQWLQSDAAQELGYSQDLSALVIASRHEIDQLEIRRRRRLFQAVAVLATFSFATLIAGLIAWRKWREARLLVGVIYMEQGLARLHDGHPMQALPYLIHARTQNVGTPRLFRLFAQATRNIPTVALMGHSDAVLSAVFNKDGTLVATASSDSTVRVWNTSTGLPLFSPLKHQNIVNSVLFSPDGTYLASASRNNMAEIWHMTHSLPIMRLSNYDNIANVVAFSSDGKRIAAMSGSTTARILNTASGVPISRTIEHNGTINAAVFSSDGTLIVTASDDRTVQVLDASTGMLLSGPFRHPCPVYTVAFSSAASRVVTVGADEQVRIWDIATGRNIRGSAQQLDGHVIALSLDGTRAITADNAKTARIWDTSTGLPVTQPLEHHGLVLAGSFSLDGTRVVTMSSDKAAQVWDSSTGASLTSLLEHPAALNAAAFSPDGLKIVTASEDGIARIWDVSSAPPGLSAVDYPYPLDGIDDLPNEVFGIDNDSFEPLEALAKCSPFVLVDGVLAPNRHPPRICRNP